jgi:mannose-1-phosphate guanylyltransferase / mannose-6-phosphate isomerase
MTSTSSKIIPVVLSGGAGTRLWPVSREEKPKQFLKFGGEHTLLQETLLRCSGKPFADHVIVVALEDQEHLISAQTKEISVKADILLEPARRDSCAAVLAGAVHALTLDPDAMVLILAADHHIGDAVAFRQAVAEASLAATDGRIVTFGVKPAYPATGYGYVLPGEPLAGNSCSKLARFREKPTRDVAEQYIAEGCLWNSGNFLARADVLERNAEIHAPEIWTAVSSAYRLVERNGHVLRPNAKAYEESPKISFDFAIMEKTSDAAVKAVTYPWSDIGTWDSVGRTLVKDASGNALHGRAYVSGGNGNVVFSDGPLTVVQGLDDVIVIATAGAVLVSRKGESEKVKAISGELTRIGLSIATVAAGAGK